MARKRYKVREAIMLGVHPATAYQRLLRKIAREFFTVRDGNLCYRCGLPIDINSMDFHFDHKVAWRRSTHPVSLYFSLDNIAMSHAACNISEANMARALEKNKIET